jgi:telomerase reverse transcriptase
VDYVIWRLFSREKKANAWPKHLLCDGFRKNVSAITAPTREMNKGQTMPGIFSVYPNHHVQALKEAPWPHILALLGKSGERIMIDLLMDTAMFVTIHAGKGNFYQLSGTMKLPSSVRMWLMI